MAVLRARGGVMEREFALGVVIQLLAPSIEPLTDRERERAFAGAAGLARPLFEEVPDRAAADDRLFARFHGLHWLCARLAEQRPLALLVDDAHWADEHSLRFLAYLEARIEEIPACAILAVRTGEAAAAPDALTKLIEHEPLTAIRPPPLSPAAVAELVRGSLGEDDGRRGLRRVRPDDGREPAARAPAHRRARGARRRAARASTPARSPPWARRRWPGSWPPGCSRRSPTVGAVARALAILGDDASLADTAEVAGVDRDGGGGRGRRADRGRAPASGPAAEVRPSDHPAGAPGLDPAGRAGAAPSRRRARAGARPGALRARGRPPAGRRPAGPVGERMGVRRADGRGATGRRPRLARPGGAIPAPGARGGGAGRAAAVDPARPRRGRVGRPHARGGRAHGGGAAPVEQLRPSARTRRSASPWCASSPPSCRRRSPPARTCSRRPTASIGSCASGSSSRPPPRASSAGSPAPRRSGGCWRSSRR